MPLLKASMVSAKLFEVVHADADFDREKARGGGGGGGEGGV
jgi:hypothetical protein